MPALGVSHPASTGPSAIDASHPGVLYSGSRLHTSVEDDHQLCDIEVSASPPLPYLATTALSWPNLGERRVATPGLGDAAAAVLGGDTLGPHRAAWGGDGVGSGRARPGTHCDGRAGAKTGRDGRAGWDRVGRGLAGAAHGARWPHRHP
jgi:hypothetical protein